jgi:hypothetical protein
MRYIVSVFFILIAFNAVLNSQVIHEELSGQVSFISSQNVYVKFKSTAGISTGDTLYIQANGKLVPALIVKNLSSSSCVCTQISSSNLSLSDMIVARVDKDEKKADNEIVAPAKNMANIQPVKTLSASDTAGTISAPKQQRQRIKGSTSLNSYLDNSNTGAPNSHRIRYTFSIDVSNIANSKFSVENYFSFRYKVGEWEEVKNDIFSALKIYSLALRYDPNKTTQISLGRRINPKISSIGASDGLQFEKSFGGFAFGALAGSRPDFTDYSFNSSLLQYGGYLSYNTKSADSYTESSLAFMQQTNNSKTDRRFLYFQHSNSIVRNLSFFSTIEVDLYELKIDSLGNEQSNSTLNPTGLYLSLYYRPGKKLSFSGSYDARKNVMYYETYKTFVDRILEDEMRQGFRLQASYRITRDLTFGLQSGYRFLKSDPHPSRNVYGYLSYSQIPGVKISATLSATYLESSYLNGNIFGLTLSREFAKGKVQTGIGYRYVDYALPENMLSVPQNIGEMNFSWQLSRSMSFAVNYEGTFEQQNHFNRFYLQLRKRF